MLMQFLWCKILWFLEEVQKWIKMSSSVPLFGPADLQNLTPQGKCGQVEQANLWFPTDLHSANTELEVTCIFSSIFLQKKLSKWLWWLSNHLNYQWFPGNSHAIEICPSIHQLASWPGLCKWDMDWTGGNPVYRGMYSKVHNKKTWLLFYLEIHFAVVVTGAGMNPVFHAFLLLSFSPSSIPQVLVLMRVILSGESQRKDSSLKQSCIRPMFPFLFLRHWRDEARVQGF